jgi:hypothetical protein
MEDKSPRGLPSQPARAVPASEQSEPICEICLDEDVASIAEEEADQSEA